MGTIIRAATGFAVALTLLHGTAFWSGLKTHEVQQIKADIVAEQPAARIVTAVSALLSPQKGTKLVPTPSVVRARDLQP